jgi:hypothetical protein
MPQCLRRVSTNVPVPVESIYKQRKHKPDHEILFIFLRSILVHGIMRMFQVLFPSYIKYITIRESETTRNSHYFTNYYFTLQSLYDVNHKAGIKVK